MHVTVRRSKPSDLPTIVGYNAAMARETEGLELDRAVLTKGVAAVMREPSRGFYLLAEAAGRVVGQTMITFEWSDWRNGDFWWIQSVYVHPAYRRARSIPGALPACPRGRKRGGRGPKGSAFMWSGRTAAPGRSIRGWE